MAAHGAERLQSEPPSVRTGWLSRPCSFSSTKLLPGQFLVRGQRISKTYRRIQACRRRWTWHPRTPPSWRGRSHWSWSWTRPGGWSTASSLAGDTEKKRKWSVFIFVFQGEGGIYDHFYEKRWKKKRRADHIHIKRHLKLTLEQLVFGPTALFLLSPTAQSVNYWPTMHFPSQAASAYCMGPGWCVSVCMCVC